MTTMPAESTASRRLPSCSRRSSSPYCARATAPQRCGPTLIAGITVAMVALPLSMAIAKASGATPERGPVHGDRRRLPDLGAGRQPLPDRRPGRAPSSSSSPPSIERHGLDGFLLATMIAGVILLAVGLLRLGTYIKYIPHPGDGRLHLRASRSSSSRARSADLLGPDPRRARARCVRAEARSPLARRDTVTPSALVVTAASLGLILGLQAIQAALAGLPHRDRRRRRSLSLLLAKRASRSRRSARDFGGIPSTLARARSAAPSRSRSSTPSCRTPHASRCSAASSRCSRPSSPTA